MSENNKMDHCDSKQRHDDVITPYRLSMYAKLTNYHNWLSQLVITIHNFQYVRLN